MKNPNFFAALKQLQIQANALKGVMPELEEAGRTLEGPALHAKTRELFTDAGLGDLLPDVA